MGPMRSSRRTLKRSALVTAWLALVAGGVARGERLELAALAQAPVVLAAPIAQATLLGGSIAEIAWRPAAGFAALAGATEWEAFLSVDGGRTYPVRLTPHLDLARRRFAFRVPDLPSDDVRLLLRIGDEHAERAVRFATRMRIVRSPSPAADEIEAAFAAGPAPASGEPALPGGAGVLFWVEGGRDGSNLRHRRAVPADARSASDPTLLAGGPEALAGDDSDGPHFGARTPPAPHPAESHRPSAVVARSEPQPALDLLLLIQRQNE